MALRPINTIGICAGVGGLELGLQLAAACVGQSVRGVCYVEREAAAADSLVASMEAGWFHPAPIWSDLGTFDGRRFRGLVDCITSGDPCQPNSVAGKGLGADDERFLIHQVLRVVDECGPDLIVRENVTGNAAGQLDAIVPPLVGMGFRVAAGIFSSAQTGNTQKRERLFIMACREGGGLREQWPQGAAGRLGHADGGSEGLENPVGSSGGRRADVPGQREIGRITPDGAGAGSVAVDGPSGIGHVDADDTIRSGRDGAVDAGGSMADAEGQLRRLHKGPWRPGEGTGHAGGHGLEMAGASGLGRWTEGHEGQPPDDAVQLRSRLGLFLPPAVIPGPADDRGWRDVLDRFPEYQPALSEEEAESHLRRGIDAMAHRIERLRASGNGVDPVVAATAVIRLRALLDRAGASPGATVVRMDA